MANLREDGYHVSVDDVTVERAKRMLRTLTQSTIHYLIDGGQDGRREFYADDVDEPVAQFDSWGNLIICGETLARLATADLDHGFSLPNQTEHRSIFWNGGKT